jgi:protein-S-isoprenylcysteine O-methyltransferase Ste14
MPDPALWLFGGGLAAWAGSEAALTAIDRPAPGTLALPTGLLVLASHVAGVVEHLGGRDSPAAAIAIGGALLGLGIALRGWAIAALGAGFATALDGARLVTSGPYHWMRHPSEAGLLMAMLGGGVLLASRLALLATLAAVPLAVVRCRREDAALARRHRTAHAAWARRVGWLVRN